MEIFEIQPSYEKPFRKALGHAIRDEIDDLHDVLLAMTDEQVLFSAGLCRFVTGYVTMDVSGRQWPIEENLRDVAEATTRWPGTAKYDLRAQQSYEYVRRVAFGLEPVDQVFPAPADPVVLSLVITGRVLVSFCPIELTWSEYLNHIEDLFEVAETVELDLLPALMLRWRRLGQPYRGKSKSSAGPPTPSAEGA